MLLPVLWAGHCLLMLWVCCDLVILAEIFADSLKMTMTITARAEDTGVVVILKEAATPLKAISRMRQLQEVRSVAAIRKRLRRRDRSMKRLMRKPMGLTDVDERLSKIQAQSNWYLRPSEYLILHTQKQPHAGKCRSLACHLINSLRLSVQN